MARVLVDNAVLDESAGAAVDVEVLSGTISSLTVNYRDAGYGYSAGDRLSIPWAHIGGVATDAELTLTDAHLDGVGLGTKANLESQDCGSKRRR